MLLTLAYLINEACGYVHQKLIKDGGAPRRPGTGGALEKAKQERDALMLQVQGLQENLRKQKETLQKAQDTRTNLLMVALCQKDELKLMQQKIQALRMDMFDLRRVRDQLDSSWLWY